MRLRAVRGRNRSDSVAGLASRLASLTPGAASRLEGGQTKRKAGSGTSRMFVGRIEHDPFDYKVSARGLRVRTTRCVIRASPVSAIVDLPNGRSDMTCSEPSTLLATPVMKPGGAHDERSSCLVCGARIGSGEPTIKIRGALVHVRCAAYRRRVARR